MFDSLSEKFSSAFKHLQGKGKISEKNIEDTLKEVKLSLLEADVNFKVVKSFVEEVLHKALGAKVVQGVEPCQQFIKIMNDELTDLMGGKVQEIDFASMKSPVPILVVGLNGAGKTTFCGKLSLFLRDKNKRDVLLVPADTFRPAAKEQLITHAKDLGVEYFDSDFSQTPAKIAKLAMEEAVRRGISTVIIDTAGRLHVDESLMAEIVQVKEAIKSHQPEILLVADALTGQEAVNVASTFHQALNLTGVVLSKMDSDAKGGAALTIKKITGVPIRYIATGETMKDLELFHPDRLSGRILDQGDVVSLVEKAEEIVDEKEAEQMLKNLEKNRFTVEDFMKQMETINKMGSMESILKMIPGMGGMLRNAGDLSPAKDEMQSMRVIADSMTKKERNDYKIINGSRKERIAKGSGKSVPEVNKFLEKFRQMEKMMTGMFGSMMKGGQMPFNIPGMDSGVGGAGAETARKGFRQMPGVGGKRKKIKKGKKRGPFGGGFFSK